MNALSGDAIPSGMLQVDATNRVVYANAVIAEWVGAPTTEVVGRTFDELLRPPASSGAASAEYLVGLMEVANVDGSNRSVFLAEGTPDADGLRFVTVFDATAQREFRENLQSRHSLVERTQRRLELVIGASIAFAETTSEAELASVLAATTAAAYAAEESVVFLLDDDMVFQHVAGTNPLVGLADADILTARAAELRSVIKISGVDEARAVSPAIGDAFEASGVQSIIVAPIHQGDQQLGILAAFFRHPRQFDEQATPLAEALAGQAARAISALRLQKRLEHAAMHDDTTGLPNRRLLEQQIDESRRASGTIRAVLFVDLDGFKNVNDQRGHQVGDQVLREVAARLQSSVRNEDVVARYGGDEFVVVCDVADEQAALDLAERVRESVRAPYAMLSGELVLGASIGISMTPADAAIIAIDEQVRAADRAMYSAKYAGGDRVASAN
jgi:diguanylate cyclase (GGDEF)-like protein